MALDIRSPRQRSHQRHRVGRAPQLRLSLENELIIDLFAGGGGASLGFEMALGRSPDVAVNHDPEAIALHEANHPTTKHFCKSVWEVTPMEVCGGRPIGALWLSPDCKHFSKAKGGKPVEKGIRDLAWVAHDWTKLPPEIRPRIIFLENVEEFQDWGDLTAENKPDPACKGLEFRRWINEFWKAGATAIEWREMRASLFGTPTIRKRLFVIIRFDGQPIVWPAATHGPGLQPFRTAADCIDWSLPCPSIFGRKKALATNTLKRIAAGIKRFVIDSPKPFIVPVTHQGDARAHSIDEPLRTVTSATRGEFALTTPFVTKFREGSIGTPIDEPLHTITAGGKQARPGTGNAMGLVTPIIVSPAHSTTTGRGPNTWSVEEPLRTTSSVNDKMLVTPVMVGVGGRAGQSRPRGLDEAMATTTSKYDTALVAPLLVEAAHGEESPTGVKRWGKGYREVQQPLPTVLASGVSSALVGATLIQTGYGEREGQAPRAPGLDKPLGTVVAGGGKHALVSAFMAQHNGDVSPKPGRAADAPLSTITTTGRQQQVTAALLTKHNAGHGAIGQDLEEAMHTITAKDTKAITTATLLHNTTGHAPGQPGDPLATITTGGHHGLVASHLTKFKGTAKDGQPVDEPLHTVQAGGFHYAETRAFLLEYYSTGGQWQTPADPMNTIPTKDRFGLVTVGGQDYIIADIGMRMLQPRELYRAQGFPEDYKIDIVYKGKPLTKAAQVRMCGNSVCPPIAAAIVAANFKFNEQREAEAA